MDGNTSEWKKEGKKKGEKGRERERGTEMEKYRQRGMEKKVTVRKREIEKDGIGL